MRHSTEANQTAQLLDMINTTMNLSSNVSSEMGLHVLSDPKGYLVIVNGYVVPILAIVVLIANVIVILVLRRQQTYGASQAGLVSVAISDTLTLLLPAPFYFYQYALHHYYVDYVLCEPVDWISIYLPTITHTASIWLTVLLTAQRYLYVCHPFVARELCTLRNTTISIAITYVIACLTHLVRAFVMYYIQFDYFDPTRNTSATTCERGYKEWLDPDTYMGVYMMIRIVLIQFVPCIVLIFLNVRIVNGLQDVVNKKMRLHNKSESSISAVKENTRVTIMIVFMAAVTLLVELPSGIILSFYVSPFITNVEVFDVNTLNSMQIIANLVIIFSYPMNFFIYCSMSAEFKQTLYELCFGCCNTRKKNGNLGSNSTHHYELTANNI
ncbi:sex peptide receptor-like [Mytilus trossulus]|uniref:sex peptide receptor-like n=1 Tax=Mytilus trossulus TaxID=6551 RepID=UPI003003E6E9